MVAGQKVAIGRQFSHQTVTVHVSETTLAIELPDGDTLVVRRTTDQAVKSITGQRPPTGSAPDESSHRVDLIEKVADESAMIIHH